MKFDSNTLAAQKIPIAKTKYLRLFYFFSSGVVFFYSVKNYFEYGAYKWLPLTVPGLILMALLPLYARRTNDFKKTAMLTVGIPSICMYALIYEAGGIHAPGVFWLSALPMTYGILLGRKGGIWGAVALGSYIALLKVLEQLGFNGSIQFTEESYLRERTIDLITFSIYIITQIQYFVHNEEVAQQQLQNYSQEIESLLRMVVHDLSTPVTVSSMSLKQLQSQTADAADVQNAMRRLGNGLDNATKILQQVKLLKALHDGKHSLQNEVVSVNEAIELTLNLLEPRAQEKSVPLLFTPCPDEPHIQAETTIFRNVVIANFITNAIKFSEPKEPVHIRVRSTHDKVHICIEDHGLGIPVKILKNLWSLHSATSRPGTLGETGTGYGMPLAKEFTEKMGGSISVQSRTKENAEENSGTIFTLTFPRKAISQSANA